jgi:3-oxoacyl-[acyl-carrier-protein] synthase III
MNGVLAIDSFLASGARYGLVVTGEKGSLHVKNTIRELRAARSEAEFAELLAGLTVGDVGAAFLLGRKQHPDHGFAGFDFASDGNHADLCWCGDQKGFGAVHTDMPRLLKESTDLGVTVYDRLIRTLKWSNSDLRWYIPHQIGKVSFKIHTRATGVPASKMPNSYKNFGNLITGNIPVCVDTIDDEHGLTDGDKLWLAGAGSGVCAGHAGLVWG